MKKTRANVEKLKIQWLADPCWCLEKTEGFEEYEEELKEFADSKRKEWKENDDLLSLKMAEQFGVYLCDNPNSALTQVIPSKFGKMMRCLLDRLDRLEREVESLHYTGDE